MCNNEIKSGEPTGGFCKTIGKNHFFLFHHRLNYEQIYELIYSSKHFLQTSHYQI